jgi:DNA-binding MurR/RpiR family transcriptional regulator
MDPLLKIRQAIDSAPPAVVTVGEWILRHPTQAATLGIEEMAAQSGASTASVNRLARAAGYAGFIALKADLLKGLRDAVDPLQKLRGEQNKGVATLASYMSVALSNLEGVGRANTEKALAEAADLLAGAGRIYVLGMGITANVAGWFVDTLSSYTGNVVNLAHSGGTERCAARLSRITKGDALVVLTLPRYSKDALTMAIYAKQRGAKVLAVTDSPAAPIMSHANKSLFAPCVHSVFSASYVAVQLICEALVAEVVRRDPESIRVATELTDAVLSRLTFSSYTPK